MGTFHKVAEAKGLAPGKGMAIEVAGNRIALFNVDETCYAIADTCTHRGGPLSEGSLEGSTVTCPWHGADFDVCWQEPDATRASGSDILQRARRGGRCRSRDILGIHGYVDYRVARGSYPPPAPTPPCVRFRTRRFTKNTQASDAHRGSSRDHGHASSG